MATNSIQSNPLDQLARALVTRFDANQDGQLTTDEFTNFLSQFLGSAMTATGTTGTGTVGATGLHGTVKPTMNGFNAAKLADPNHNTMKYQFGRVAQNYSLEGVTDKKSGEALLNQMKPDLEAAGLDVLAVKGDKIQVKDDAGQSAWIDVIFAANSGAPAWQWLDTRF